MKNKNATIYLKQLNTFAEGTDGSKENPYNLAVGYSKFDIAEGKGKGEFYTPKSIVNLIAQLIEPDDGTELKIRQQLIENDLVEAIIILPRNLFYTTDISVTLWILNKNKKA